MTGYARCHPSLQQARISGSTARCSCPFVHQVLNWMFPWEILLAKIIFDVRMGMTGTATFMLRLSASNLGNPRMMMVLLSQGSMGKSVMLKEGTLLTVGIAAGSLSTKLLLSPCVMKSLGPSMTLLVMSRAS